MATCSSILTWKIPWTEEPGAGYSPWGRKESDMTERLSTQPTQEENKRIGRMQRCFRAVKLLFMTL